MKSITKESLGSLIQPLWNFVGQHTLLSLLSAIAAVCSVISLTEFYGGSNWELINSIFTVIAVTIGLVDAVRRLRSKDRDSNRLALWLLVGWLLFFSWYLQFMLLIQLVPVISIPVQIQPLLQTSANLFAFLFPVFQPLTVIAYIREGQKNASVLAATDKAKKNLWSNILLGILVLCIGVVMLSQSTPTSDPRSVWLGIGTGLIGTGLFAVIAAVWQYLAGS